MAKNGTLSKVIAIIAAGTVLLILGIMIRWGPAIQENANASAVNKTDIKRVDSDMKTAIMEQKVFIKDTGEKLHAIDKGVGELVIEFKAHNKNHNP